MRYNFNVLSLLSVDNTVYIFCRKRSMSSIVNSFVIVKLHNNQLVYDFVKQKYRQIHPSLKQDINVVVKQLTLFRLGYFVTI